MITLKDFMELVNYRITEGSEYFMGDRSNLYALSYWNGLHDDGGHSIEVIFDTSNQEVVHIEAHDYEKQRAYRFINDPVERKSAERTTAWDDVDFIDLELESDFMEKAQAILNGEEYDERVVITFELPEREAMILFKEAHRRDITFNQLIEEALIAKMDEMGFELPKS